MDVPHVTRADYQLSFIDEGYLKLLDEEGNEKDVAFNPDDELGQQIINDNKNGKELMIGVISSMGEETAISSKEAKETN